MFPSVRFHRFAGCMAILHDVTTVCSCCCSFRSQRCRRCLACRHRLQMSWIQFPDGRILASSALLLLLLPRTFVSATYRADQSYATGDVAVSRQRRRHGHRGCVDNQHSLEARMSTACSAHVSCSDALDVHLFLSCYPSEHETRQRPARYRNGNDLCRASTSARTSIRPLAAPRLPKSNCYTTLPCFMALGSKLHQGVKSRNDLLNFKWRPKAE